jgi:ElaB/YqjD/DUF883 family membrane-anchored ribosome-binding protein
MSSTTFGKSTEQFEKAKDTGSDAVAKAKQAGKEAVGAAREAGKEAVGAAREAGAEALAGAKDAGARAMDKAKEAVSAAGEMAASTASAMGKKADDLTAAAGHRIGGLGDTLAQKAPHEGMAGAASQAVAEGIKESGRYIEQAKLSGMAHDVEHVIKNHPIPALLVCFGIGFCLGRMIKE